MKEKNNTKPEKCPYCGKTDIVVNGYDSTIEKHQDTNVKTVKRRLKKIRIIILKIKQINYLWFIF